MTEPTPESQPSEIVAQTGLCTVTELCRACGVEAEWLSALVEEGVIEAVGQAPSEWRFTSVAVVRVTRAKRLERDLGLNTPGIALALDLLDQIDDLRSRLMGTHLSR